MMRLLRIRLPEPIPLLLLLAAVGGCGDDDGAGPDGGDDGNPTAELATALTGAGSRFFTANADAFLALQTFAPYFAGGAGPSVVPRSPAPTGLLLGCIDPAWLGVTFEFDFTQNAYSPSETTGAPADGVRFLLYEEQQARGQVDFLCPGDLPQLDVALVLAWDGDTVLEFAGVGTINAGLAWQFNTTSATLLAQDGGTLGLSFGGTGVGPQVVSSRIGFSLDAAGLTVTFGRNDAEGLAITGQAGGSAWSLSLMADGPADGSLSGNVILSTPPADLLVIACLSGFYDDLTVSTDESVLATCAGDFGFATLSPDPQQQIDQSYQALRRMLDVVIAILGTGVQLAVAAA